MGLLSFLRSCRGGSERSYALNDLDLKLSRYLDFRDGFFVEAGANDGIRQSNTLFFERHRGWRGLLIEPVPALAKRCSRNRPRCKVECCALVSPEAAHRPVEMQYANLMSLVKGAMKSPEADRDHVRRGCELQSTETYELQAPGRTLSEVLVANGISRVDLLSLDVEGYELQALQGLDFAKHRPDWILVEARFRSEIDALLSAHYDTVAELSHHDVLYRARTR